MYRGICYIVAVCACAFKKLRCNAVMAVTLEVDADDESEIDEITKKRLQALLLIARSPYNRINYI